MKSCRHCRTLCDRDTSRCRKHLDELVDQLVHEVKALTKGKARRLYIGRTNHPERRLIQHVSRETLTPREVEEERDQGCRLPPRDHLAVLHWSGSWREVQVLEVTLIERCHRRWDKFVGEPDIHSRGDWYGNWNCIYVSWAPKQGVLYEGAVPVKHLDWPLVYPSEEKRPLVLRSEVGDAPAAKRCVANFFNRRDELLEKIRRR